MSHDCTQRRKIMTIERDLAKFEARQREHHDHVSSLLGNISKEMSRIGKEMSRIADEQTKAKKSTDNGMKKLFAILGTLKAGG